MKILAFDTSSEVLSMAVADDERLLGFMELPLFTRNSSTLAPSLDAMLKSCRLTAKDVDCLAVGLGPGSFTGLRVGITTAKVMAYSLGIKIVGISSLEARAGSRPAAREPVAVLLDAKKGKIYAALYAWKGGVLRALRRPSLTTRPSFLAKIKGRAVFLGEGDEAAVPNAAYLARAGLDLARKKKFIGPEKLEPAYLHPRDCNVVLKKKKT